MTFFAACINALVICGCVGVLIYLVTVEQDRRGL